jgi:hypothetical protein
MLRKACGGVLKGVFTTCLPVLSKHRKVSTVVMDGLQYMQSPRSGPPPPLSSSTLYSNALARDREQALQFFRRKTYVKNNISARSASSGDVLLDSSRLLLTGDHWSPALL